MAKTYLITGASGIGAETAKLLAEDASTQEIRLFLVALDEAACQSLADDLKSAGAQVAHRSGDLTNPSVAIEAVSSCLKHFGRIDALFNVAGGSGRRYGDGPIHECTEEGWSRTIEENATTTYRMCREAINVMLRQPPSERGERGVILNMSSVLAIHPEPTHFETVAYAASKGAILSISRTMAASYAKSKIRVNVVAPALVSTAMSARASQDPVISGFIQRKQPLFGGMIPAGDVASVCKFLLTDASCAMTGQIVEVDAGWSIG